MDLMLTPLDPTRETMVFTTVFEINPSGVFGLAEARTTVIPPTSKGASLGLVVDLQGGRVIDKSRESSIYRDKHEKIDVSLKLGDTTGRILDNVMTLDVETDDYQKAYLKACGVVDVFLQHLAVSQGLLFKARATGLEDCKGIRPIPASIPLGSLRIYNLSKLADDIREAECSWGLSDERLARALEYFEHALFLFEIARNVVFSSGRHSALCVSESFLNLWKCETSIVGDPSVRKDGYQRRCTRLGLDNTQKEALARIARLRNDYDVAHYSLSTERIRVVEKEFGRAMITVGGLVRRYKEHLHKGEKINPPE
jgi:hypothetical protein